MKRIIFSLVAASLVFSTNAFAVGEFSGTEQVIIGGSNLISGEPSPELKIGLSPKVNARYITDGTDETLAQWYAIAAVHPGGNMAYATAQDVNNIGSQKYTTGSAVDTYLESIPAGKGEAWTIKADGDGGWAGIQQPPAADGGSGGGSGSE